MNHGHLDGRHGTPGNAAQPVRRDYRGRQQLGIRGPQLCVGGQRLHDGVTGELGVPLPFDPVTLKAQTQEVAVQADQRQLLLPGQATYTNPENQYHSAFEGKLWFFISRDWYE